MEELYAGHGVRFQYPADWELSEQVDPGRVAISVASPHTSFWSLYLFFDRPDPDDVLEAVLEAFRDEYTEIDVYPSKVQLCEQPTLARDIEFVCLELLNSAWARVFQTEEFTALVLYQANDDELELTGPAFDLITSGLSCDEIDPDLE